AACTERGIPIVMLDVNGDVFATLYAAGLTGTVLTRREQLLAYYDERGLTLAQAFAAAKITNQVRTLRYWSGNRRSDHPDIAAVLEEAAAEIQALADAVADALTEPDAETARAVLMGLEGRAAAIYWGAAAQLIPAHYAWPGRVGRGAVDPINSLLNYGYGILYAQIERAIVLAGLDPYAGFLHADRPGKPSLVLDLIEEFRQAAVDRVVIGLAARGYQIEQDEFGQLAQATRRDFASKIIGQLDARVRCGGGSERVPLRHAIQMQARHIATFVRRERMPYTPFIMET
ncbi:MAG: CRISPR-associated endonuclease Cas1, partial [Anaerolinea sp.]|nr:CRISPR-associated endonuclease Cas1 [Anaerolinea sp.]